MGADDTEMVEILRQRDASFSRLFDEHGKLDQKIRRIESRAYLSTEDEMEIKRLKKIKLRTKDKMTQILKRHQKSESV